MVNNLPVSAEDMGWIPGPRRSHKSWSSQAGVPPPLSRSPWSPTREAHRNWRAALTCHNWRKRARSEDSAQPKINKKQAKADVFLTRVECLGSGKDRQHFSRTC